MSFSQTTPPPPLLLLRFVASRLFSLLSSSHLLPLAHTPPRRLPLTQLSRRTPHPQLPTPKNTPLNPSQPNLPHPLLLLLSNSLPPLTSQLPLTLTTMLLSRLLLDLPGGLGISLVERVRWCISSFSSLSFFASLALLPLSLFPSLRRNQPC